MTSTPLPQDRRPIVISGTFAFTVSHTTRKPRAGEIEGKQYYFISPATFATLIEQDAFVEHATFSGNQYETSEATIAEQMAKGLVVVLDIEMDGVRQAKAGGLEARYLFVEPPSFEALEERLRGRGTESDEDVWRRLDRARVELEFADVPGVYNKIVVNDDLETAFRELEEFVYRPVSLC